MTYTRLKKLIESGNYIKSDMLNKLDMFFVGNRLTTDEYVELCAMME